MRTCPVCQTDMSAMHYRRTYCSRKCQMHASRARARATYHQTFVGVDGEGINLPSGEHRYVMLSCGDQTLWKNGDALDHHDCLAFLYECMMDNPDKRAAYIGFYLGYDFAMILKSITEHEATMLFTPEGIAKRKRKSSPMPFPVYLGSKWEIDMLGMKRLRFRPHVHNSKRGKCACGYTSPTMPEKSDKEWMIICDVGSFFQTAFVNVLDPTAWHGEAPCTGEEYRTIIDGKAARSNRVTLDDLSWFEPMRQYNILENRLLANVMTIYNDGFAALGVKLNRTSFYGPGQAAQQWLNGQAKGKVLQREQLAELIPSHVIDAWRRTYYGGRFEIFYHGVTDGLSYEYDIQSAYPHAIASLPCLCRAQWHSVDTVSDWTNPLTVVYATVTGKSEYVGPLPYRLRTGAISYPRRTTGWYRVVELLAAFEADLVSEIDVHSVLECYRKCRHDPPLKALAGLFDERIRVGKATPHGKALKLVYNSCYGKMAQSIGEPRYANPIYASIITSDCRIRLLQAIGTHPDGENSLLMTATDGIYFSTPHPDMPDPAHNVERLGDWESATKSNLTLMKPGVYWDDKARTAIAAGKSAKLKSRGISGAVLQKHIGDIDQQFRDHISGDAPLPTIHLRSPFNIVSPRLALARGKWHTAGKVEYDLERTDSAVIWPKRRNTVRATDTLLRSFAPDNREYPGSWESHPYNKHFGFDMEGNEILDDDYYSPDGPSIQLAQSDLIGLGNA